MISCTSHETGKTLLGYLLYISGFQKKLGVRLGFAAHCSIIRIIGKTANSHKALDMGHLTFFLWEINSIFLLLTYGFGVLAMRWNHLEHCARGILAEFGGFDDFLKHFLWIYHYFDPWILIIVTISMFGVQGIKLWHVESCQTTKVTKLRGILAQFCYFSAVSSIFNQFIILLTLVMQLSRLYSLGCNSRPSSCWSPLGFFPDKV